MRPVILVVATFLYVAFAAPTGDKDSAEVQAVSRSEPKKEVDDLETAASGHHHLYGGYGHG